MNTSQDSERGYYREAPIAREPKRNNSWLPLLLLLPLLFVGGFLLGNNMENNQDEATVSASTAPRFGVGAGPGYPTVTPLPEDDNIVIQDDKTSPSPTTTASPQTSTPSATMQRTGDESSI